MIRGPQNAEIFAFNANGRESAALPRMAANFPEVNVARLVRVSCWMNGLVFDHEWARIHTNDEDTFREIRADSWSFVVLSKRKTRTFDFNANGREFAALPRMAANETG